MKEGIKKQVTLDRITIDLTNTDKMIYPKDKITKGQVIDYYQKIASIMIPHIKGHPISMQRFPDGIHGEGFFQKDAGSYFPNWIPTKAVKRESGGTVNYVVCNNKATLVYLANQLCLTPHVWLSRADKLRFPDRMIFDLDPSGTDFSLIVDAAHYLKKMLEEYGLKPFVMTTGSRGLHVVTPLKRTATFAQVRTFARAIAHKMALEHPNKFTVELRKNKRKKRVFIDYLRNGFGATAVCPYALRPIDGAPVATPITWREVTNKLSPQQFTIKNIFKRLANKGDAWKGMERAAKKLPKIS